MANLSIGIIPVTSFQQNCALMWNDETLSGVVVDPGGDVDHIMQAIEQTGIKVETILLTHGHLDHVGGAMELKEKLGVEIVGPHIDDKPVCEGVEEVARMYNLEGQFKNCTPDTYLSEGDTVSIGGWDFSVFHCPGHSPGHVIFFSDDHKFAHVGDVLFKGSVGRTDLPGGSHDDLISSIRTKLLPLGDEVSFLCGHGPGGTLGEERKTNPFLGS
jgi:glyoxylase-like metal-dependent hydrolase (beta-lactamase superfamily II)